MEDFDKKEIGRIIFYRNKEMPDYYMLYCGARAHIPKIMLQMLNHTGKHKDCGYPDVNVELAYILETGYDVKELLDFIATQISTDHIIGNEFYNCMTARCWCKLETYDPDQWQKDFHEYRYPKIDESKKNIQYVQKTLF